MPSRGPEVVRVDEESGRTSPPDVPQFDVNQPRMEMSSVIRIAAAATTRTPRAAGAFGANRRQN